MTEQALLGYFARMRFQTKLTISSALLVSVALMLACIGLLGLQYMTEHRLSEQRHEQIMQVIAANTGPALMFADAEAARENLMSINRIDDVSAVFIRDTKQQLFVAYQNPLTNFSPSQSTLKDLARPIVVDGVVLGTLVMQVRQRSFLDILGGTWAAMLVLFSICLAFSMSAAKGLNRIAFRPIERLIEAMYKITVSSDYSMRLTREQDPDFAAITDNFNGMVAAVEHRDLELTQNARELREARDQAEKANIAKSQFLANMSHELRTPLNAILGYTDVLTEELKEAGNARSLEDVQWIYSSARQLLELINSILDLSKIEAGRMDMDIHEFDVSTTVREVEKMLAPTAAQRNNRIHVQIADDVGVAYSDSVKLRQALLNLGSNACKFTDGGQIFLLARREDDKLIFAVSDTGIGMDQDEVARLFEPFSQADATTTRRFGGTGLGLTITQRFASMLRGDVQVESEPDIGSTFTLRIAADLRDEADEGDIAGEELANPAALTLTKKAPEFDRSRPLAIVIDDEPSAAQLLVRVATQAGYSTLLAANGKEGLELVRSQRPTIILLDIAMPKVNGWDVLEALRSDAALSATPVVVVSVCDDRKKTIEAGASDHLIKPISRTEVSEVLAQYAELRSGKVLVVDDDEATAKLYCRGIEQAGYSATIAHNGKAAQQLITEHEYDFVVTDLRMPEIDGHELIEWISHLPTKTKPLVFVVTGKAMNNEDTCQLEHKVASVIAKNGLSPRKLAEALSIAETSRINGAAA